MRNVSALLVIASLLWLASLGSIGQNVHLTLPGAGDGVRAVGPGLPILPFGDDGGGSH